MTEKVPAGGNFEDHGPKLFILKMKALGVWKEKAGDGVRQVQKGHQTQTSRYYSLTPTCYSKKQHIQKGKRQEGLAEISD